MINVLPLNLIKKIIYLLALISSAILIYADNAALLGSLAFYALSLAIFIRPTAQVFSRFNFLKFLLAVRRQIGVSSAIFAFAHVLTLTFRYHSFFSLINNAISFGFQNFMFWGFLAFLVIIPLFLTSNDFSVRLLKRHWKTLHLLIHPLYIFVLLHQGLSKGGLYLIEAVILLIALYLLRFLARQKTKVPPTPISSDHI